ncbi:MAG: ATP synthase subunit I [Gammaproteobacteria bacterium]|nr:ATP synthase subunit I [Gammaproteobacteria bacterium]
MGNPTRAYIRQWLYYQVLASVVVVTVLSLIKARLGWSSGIGCMAVLLANGYQGLRVALTRLEYNPVELLKNFYKGELGKFVILAFFVIVCAKFLPLTWWAFIVGILGAQLGGAILLMLVKGK